MKPIGNHFKQGLDGHALKCLKGKMLVMKLVLDALDEYTKSIVYQLYNV